MTNISRISFSAQNLILNARKKIFMYIYVIA